VFGSEAAVTGDALGLAAAWAYRVITQVGSYGEIYAAHLEPIGVVRAGSQNDSYVDGGLLYVPPMGRG
jgi:general L-amino acid transport system substrate-binding protein